MKILVGIPLWVFIWAICVAVKIEHRLNNYFYFLFLFFIFIFIFYFFVCVGNLGVPQGPPGAPGPPGPLGKGVGPRALGNPKGLRAVT